MNYIRHLNKASEIMYDDSRLTAFHIALYMALFMKWNLNRFKNPVIFDRIEVMQASHIGSLTTYTRTLKELHEWKYLRYIPGQKRAGTTVYMVNLCTPECTGKCTANCTDTCTVCRTHAVRQSVHISADTLYIDNKDNKHIDSKGGNAISKDDIRNFFLENNSTEVEAERFFFHYESNGWKLGNQLPMIDWKASVQKWILNTSNFNNYGKRNKNNRPTAGHLHAGNNKDYSEPL